MTVLRFVGSDRSDNTDNADSSDSPPSDRRLDPPSWTAAAPPPLRLLKVVTCSVLGVVATIWYLSWLLRPERIGHPALFALLVCAELFNVAQAVGFWWTASRGSARSHRPRAGRRLPAVDVLVPVYGEPVEVVEPTIAAAVAMRGARVEVALLDDGGSPEMEALARRHGVRYIRRTVHSGAKAGNINHALDLVDSPFVAVFDCDHVPSPDFLERTLGHLDDDGVAMVQTPQWYANAPDNDVADAAAAQQSLFFGPIARGKDARGSMFCCGTNMVFRREALDDVGGFPEDSVTEDFQLSLRLHEQGWRTAYVSEVLAQGLGPEDMASYASQQQRWARGCLSALPAALRARLPWRTRVQYLLSASYFLTGWTVLLYMSLPVVRILTGAQPVAGTDADEFFTHFAPYFGLALLMVALAGAGAYTWRAFALQFASWWIHVDATVRVLRGRPGRFVVTPKRGSGGVQLRAVWPSVVAMGVLVSAAVVGLIADRSPGTLNNVAFVGVHVVVLATGIRSAWISPVRATARTRRSGDGVVAAA
jgi:cellulose synthase (UDP-forming)